MKIGKIVCREAGCKGVPFSVPVSRMELSFGHVKYQCDQCGSITKRVYDLTPQRLLDALESEVNHLNEFFAENAYSPDFDK